MEYNELILDMLNRIVKLEKEVEELKNKRPKEEEPLFDKSYFPEKPQQRDKTRYMFDGNVYLKNRLVLAVVKKYVSDNPTISCLGLKAVFDKSLQGSIGVVEFESVAKHRSDYQIRFFSREDEVIKCKDGNMLVCSQWGILNIPNFVKRAEQLNYKIEQITKENTIEQTPKRNMSIDNYYLKKGAGFTAIPRIKYSIDEINKINAMWQMDQEDTDDSYVDYKISRYIKIITYELFVKNYYYFKESSTSQICKDLLFVFSAEVVQSIAGMVRFIYDTGNETKILDSIITSNEYVDVKIYTKAQEILKEKEKNI